MGCNFLQLPVCALWLLFSFYSMTHWLIDFWEHLCFHNSRGHFFISVMIWSFVSLFPQFSCFHFTSSPFCFVSLISVATFFVSLPSQASLVAKHRQAWWCNNYFPKSQQKILFSIAFFLFIFPFLPQLNQRLKWSMSEKPGHLVSQCLCFLWNGPYSDSMS